MSVGTNPDAHRNASLYNAYFKWFATKCPDVIEKTVGSLEEKRRWGRWYVFAPESISTCWQLLLIYLKDEGFLYPIIIPSGRGNLRAMPTRSVTITPISSLLRDVIMDLARLGHERSCAIMRRKWEKAEKEIKKRGIAIYPDIENNVWRVCSRLSSDKMVIIEDDTGFKVGYKTHWRYVSHRKDEVTRVDIFDALLGACSTEEALETVARNDAEKEELLMHMLSLLAKVYW